MQLSGEINSGNRILDAYINGTFRVLGGEDAVFRKYALTRAVQDRARAQALTEARRGRIKRADINTRAKQIAASPDARLMTDAIFDSEVAVFSNQNLPNKFLSAGREKLAKSRAGRAVNFGVDILLPFTKTPTNIIARMLDYSGVGFGGQVAKAIVKRSFTAEQQRQFATTFGRGATGGSLMLLGYKLYQAGLMTGLADDDPGLRNRDVAAGRTPGAILNPETGTWHQVSAFSPLGSLLAIGATLARESEQERKDESKRAEKIAAAGMQTIAQQPMLTGAKEVSEAITRPGTTGERAGRIAGSFVPTLVSDIGELTDSTRREGRGFVGQMQKRVPFARTSLPAATDVLGKPLEDRKTAFFDPTLTSTARDKSDPLMSELTRLNVGLTAPRKFDDETPEDYRARKAQTGQRFEKYGRQLVESQKFKTATKERQKAAVERLLKNIRDTSDEATPDSYQFSPGGLFEAVVAAEFRRKASTAKK